MVFGRKRLINVEKKEDTGIAVASNIHLQFVQPVHYVKKFSIFCEVIEICCFIFVITIFLLRCSCYAFTPAFLPGSFENTDCDP